MKIFPKNNDRILHIMEMGSYRSLLVRFTLGCSSLGFTLCVISFSVIVMAEFLLNLVVYQ